MKIDNQTKQKSNMNMKSRNEGIQTIYKRLREIGINKNYLHKVILPDWWDREILKTSSGLQEFLLHISKNLGISTQVLISNSKLELNLPHSPEFKHSQNQKTEKFNLFLSQSLAIAHKLDSLYSAPSRLPESALEVRQVFSEGNPLRLENLLKYLLDLGIIVIPPLNLPKKTSAPQGIIFKINKNRPVICLGQNKKSSVIQMFTILHELGHIVSGHLSISSEPIFDIKIEKDFKDAKEVEANRFALEVFSGSPNFAVQLKAEKDSNLFTQACIKEGKKQKILPEFLAINFGWNNPDYWALVNSSLKSLEKENALHVLHNFFFDTLSDKDIGENYLEYLSKVIAI